MPEGRASRPHGAPPRVRAPLGAPKPITAGASSGPEASLGRTGVSRKLWGTPGQATGGAPSGKLASPLAGSSCGPSASWQGRKCGVSRVFEVIPQLEPRPHHFQPTQTSETRGASEGSEHPSRSTGDVVPWDRTSQSLREPPASGPRSLVPCLPFRAIWVPRLPRRGPLPPRYPLLSSFSDPPRGVFRGADCSLRAGTVKLLEG